MPFPKAQPLSSYANVLPYASQLFGVYQPILGLRSNSAKARVNSAAMAATQHVIEALASHPGVQAGLASSHHPVLPTDHIPRSIGGTGFWGAAAQHAHQAITQIRQQHHREPTPQELLNIVHAAGSHAASKHGGTTPHGHGSPFEAAREAVVQGTLQHLAQHAPHVLNAMFHGTGKSPAEALTPYMDPLSHFGPSSQAAVLSPLALIQLYREYFFELDSFLGPAVGHVWVSPGGSLEVYEVHNTTKVSERTTTQSTDTTQQTESQTQQQSELSSAISHDSSQNMNIGVQAHAGVNVGVFQAGVSASLSLGNTQKSSQQSASKQTRSQSEKVSNKIRSSFQTSFKTTLSQTDSTSRRYVLSNNTDTLVNYELRRKMRKVAVQVQYVDTQLCWQIFVDNPGGHLGISELVHLNQPADISSLQPPTAPPQPLPQTSTMQATFPFEGKGGHNETGDDYVNGHSHDFFSGDHYIVITKTFDAVPPAPGYILQQVTMQTMTPSDPSKKDAYATPSFVCHVSSFDIHLDQVNFNDSPSLIFSLNLTWAPSKVLIEQQRKLYDQQLAHFKWEEAQAVHAAYVNAVRDRIKVAGQVAKRDEDDLRLEERSVIYKSILSQLIPLPAEPGRKGEIASHVTSELIRSVFDVDSMLYYVSPDWWDPRVSKGRQRPRRSTLAPDHPNHAGAHGAHGGHAAHPAHAAHEVPAGSLNDAPPDAAPEPLTADDLVTWNGKRHGGANNYLLTEESTPAPVGASLGWFLQLDGDDRRNAFINASWVKAVLPVIPGKEMEALQWLIQDHVEGSDGLDDIYVLPPDSPDPEPELKGKTIREVLKILAQKVQATNQVTAANPPDSQAVYENGFDPLQGGFQVSKSLTPGKMFDQWLEVLPTDQVVAVEYRPPVVTPI